MRTELIKRTFQAKEFPRGSQERALLNLNTATSEYNPYYQWEFVGYVEETDLHKSFKVGGMTATKEEAEEVIYHLNLAK